MRVYHCLGKKVEREGYNLVVSLTAEKIEWVRKGLRKEWGRTRGFWNEEGWFGPLEHGKDKEGREREVRFPFL